MRVLRKTTKSKRGKSRLEQRFRRAWEFPPPGVWTPSTEFLRDHRPEQELKFHPTRKWRFDFAWLDVKLAVELQGGLYHPRGRHSRGKGQEGDYEKLNEAQRLGWVVLQFGSAHLSSHRKTRQVVRYVSQVLQELLDAKASNHYPYCPYNPTTQSLPNDQSKSKKPIRRPSKKVV